MKRMKNPTYKNLDAIPTATLKRILDNPYTCGIDGADYGPVREELEYEYWGRGNAELDKFWADYDKAQKEFMKYEASSHKRAKSA